MRTLKIFGLALLMIFVAQGKTFAEMPEISAGASVTLDPMSAPRR